jgi:hypothetical protein
MLLLLRWGKIHMLSCCLHLLVHLLPQLSYIRLRVPAALVHFDIQPARTSCWH